MSREATARKLVLLGLVGPKNDSAIDAFKDWYLENHIEDTARCPEVRSARSYRAVKGFLGEPPAPYFTVYEFAGADAEAAEAALAVYQQDPQGWRNRQPGNDSMAVMGAGWYEEVLEFGDLPTERGAP